MLQSWKIIGMSEYVSRRDAGRYARQSTRCENMSPMAGLDDRTSMHQLMAVQFVRSCVWICHYYTVTTLPSSKSPLRLLITQSSETIETVE